MPSWVSAPATPMSGGRVARPEALRAWSWTLEPCPSLRSILASFRAYHPTPDLHFKGAIYEVVQKPLNHPGRREWYEIKEIVSGMALATGMVAQRFHMQNRRLAPCRSLRECLISHHSGQAASTQTSIASGRDSGSAPIRTLSNARPFPSMHPLIESAAQNEPRLCDQHATHGQAFPGIWFAMRQLHRSTFVQENTRPRWAQLQRTRPCAILPAWHATAPHRSVLPARRRFHCSGSRRISDAD